MCVKVNPEQDGAMASQWKVQVVPTVYVLAPDGTYLEDMTQRPTGETAAQLQRIADARGPK